MIASFGGAIVNKDGSRSYPASGGYVGGLSFAGGNWAYFTGAGKSYETFTPNQTANSIPSPTELPEEPTNRDTPNFPTPTQIPLPQLPAPTIPTTTGTTTNPPVVNCLWGDCSGNIPMQSAQTIYDRIADLLRPAPRTNTNVPPTLFSFIPNGGDSSMNMKTMLVIVAVAAIAYFLYKKYA